MLLLVLLAAIGLGPDDSGSLGPMPAPPHLEAAVGGSKPLGEPRVAKVAQSAIAPGTRVSVAAGSVARGDHQVQAERRNSDSAVAPAEAIAVAAPTPQPESDAGAGDQVPSGGATDGEAPPEGTSSPAAAPLPGTEGGSGGPVAAGGGPVIESCEGDEYVITIALNPEASEEGESSVEIVLTKFNDDGSTEELRLEGDLLDAQSLALQLSSEGNCVKLEADPGSGDTAPDVP